MGTWINHFHACMHAYHLIVLFVYGLQLVAIAIVYIIDCIVAESIQSMSISSQLSAISKVASKITCDTWSHGSLIAI